MSDLSRLPGAGEDTDEPIHGQEMSDDELVNFYRNALDDAEAEEGPAVREDARHWRLYAGISASDDDQQFYAANPEVVSTDVAIFQAIMHTFLGSEMSQKVEPAFFGEDLGPVDQACADWMTKVVRKVWSACDADVHVWDAVQDCGVTGRGYAIGFIATNQRPVRPVIKALQTWRVKPDPDATEMNYADADYFVIREPSMLLDNALALYPTHTEALKERSRAGGSAILDTTPIPGPPTPGSASRSRRRHRKTVDIDTLYYRSSHSRTSFIDPKTDEYRNEPTEEFESTREQYQLEYEQELEAYAERSAMAVSMGMASEEQPPQPPTWDEESVDTYIGHCHYQATFVASAGGHSRGAAYLLDRKRIGVDQFPVKSVTGLVWKKPEEDRIRFFGLGRVCFDVIQYMMKALRSWVDTVSRANKGGGHVPDSATPEWMEEFRTKNAIPGYWHHTPAQLMPGAPGGIVANTNAQIPPDFKDIFFFCLDLLGRVTGVNEWLQGTGQGDRSNAYVANLQQTGAARLLPLRKPRIQFVTNLGSLMAAYVIRHMPAGEIDRILGEVAPIDGVTVEADEQGSQAPRMILDRKTGQMVPATPGRLLKQMDLLDYDIRADVGATTPNQRFAIADWFTTHGMATSMIKEMGVSPKIVARMVLKYSPLPEDAAQDLLRQAEEDWTMQEQQQSEQGAIQYFQGLPPEQQAQFFNQLQQMMLGPGAGAMGEGQGDQVQ